MDIAQLVTNPSTYLILIVLGVGCALYAYGYVRTTRRRNPNHGQTALFVAIGSAAVGIAYTIALAATYGIAAAIAPAFLLLLCYIAAGLPMIVEYIDDHTGEAAERNRSTALQDLLKDIDIHQED
jgi:hypothetical protein